MAQFSVYSVDRDALAVNGRSLAGAEVGPHRFAAVDDSSAGPAVRRTRAGWDAAATDVATMRSIHTSVVKLRTGLGTFVVCGALGPQALGWSLLVSLAVGLLLAVIIGNLAGSILGPRTFKIPPWSGAMIASRARAPREPRATAAS